MIKPTDGQFLGYLPFQWPPKHGSIRFYIIRIETSTIGNQSEILTIGKYSDEDRENFVKYLTFSLNQSTHQLDLVMRNGDGEVILSTVQIDHGHLTNSLNRTGERNKASGNAYGRADGRGSGNDGDRPRRDVVVTLVDDEDFFEDSMELKEKESQDSIDFESKDSVQTHGEFGEESIKNPSERADTQSIAESQDQLSGNQQEMMNNLDETVDAFHTVSTTNDLPENHDPINRHRRAGPK